MRKRLTGFRALGCRTDAGQFLFHQVGQVGFASVSVAVLRELDALLFSHNLAVHEKSIPIPQKPERAGPEHVSLLHDCLLFFKGSGAQKFRDREPGRLCLGPDLPSLGLRRHESKDNFPSLACGYLWSACTLEKGSYPSIRDDEGRGWEDPGQGK